MKYHNVNQLLRLREDILSGKKKYHNKKERDAWGLWNMEDGKEKRGIIKNLEEFTKKKLEHDKKTKSNNLQTVRSPSKRL